MLWKRNFETREESENMRIGYRHWLYGARQTWPPLDSLKACQPPQAPAPPRPSEHSEKALGAFREIFEACAANQISTIAVLKALIERGGDEPWAAWEADIRKGNTRGPAAKL